jgi:hypothetical protein
MSELGSQDIGKCDGCGLVVAGGTAGCQSVMDECLALHFTQPAYFGVHRLFVDVYSVQHPERYCVSFNSLAAHLGHLCWTVEHGGTRAVPSEAIRKWVERHPHLEKPPLPAFRGTVTIDLVRRAGTPADHHRAVETWARSAWDAYADLHGLAREWVTAALDEFRDRRGART